MKFEKIFQVFAQQNQAKRYKNSHPLNFVRNKKMLPLMPGPGTSSRRAPPDSPGEEGGLRLTLAAPPPLPPRPAVQHMQLPPLPTPSQAGLGPMGPQHSQSHFSDPRLATAATTNADANTTTTAVALNALANPTRLLSPRPRGRPPTTPVERVSIATTNCSEASRRAMPSACSSLQRAPGDPSVSRLEASGWSKPKKPRTECRNW